MKKTTINPINNDDDKCFQYVATLTSSHKELEKLEDEYQKLNFLQINIIENT